MRREFVSLWIFAITLHAGRRILAAPTLLFPRTRPRIRIRISFLDQTRDQRRDNEAPMTVCIWYVGVDLGVEGLGISQQQVWKVEGGGRR